MGRAFLRAEAMKAVGHMEHDGVPLDVSTLAASERTGPASAMT